MGLKIYGVSQSRAIRVLWMVNELDIPFEHIQQNFAGEKSPEFLAVNPNGRVPAMDDDGFRLFESLAINTYLAKKFDKGLAPTDLKEDALTQQWSLWVMTEVEKSLLNAMFFTRGIMGNPKDPDKAAACVAELQRPLAVLNSSLAGKEYLVANRFMVADLNVASVLSWAPGAKLDLSGFSNLNAWLTRCLSRPALAKARG